MADQFGTDPDSGQPTLIVGDDKEMDYCVTVAIKVEVFASDPIEARRKAIEFLNEQMEDKEPWESCVPAWQTLNVRPARQEEREWRLGDYDVDDFGGHIG